jgi:hypothetical protein
MIEDYIQDSKAWYHPYKSGSEYRIAGLLDQYGLPFIYEKPTAVMDAGKLRIWYPDFTLGYGQVIEYFGVNGDPGYEQRTRHKLAVYEHNQIPVLALYPRDFGGAWQGRLLERIDSTLEQHLNQYRTLTGRGPSCQVYRRPTGYGGR